VILIAALIALLAPPSGEYGVICFDPAKGSMKGTRVVLSGPAEDPTILFQHCENGCSRHRTGASSLKGDVLDFEIVNSTKETQTARFTGGFRGKVLNLRGLNPDFPFKSGRLRKDQACPRDTVKADP